MTEREVKLAVGGLLHDIGKVIYRTGDGRKHSQSGYEFLKEEVKLDDKDILNCVRYHHSDSIKGADIENDSLAYIVYIADNIASAADRRKREVEDYGFEASMPLQPVFNILNGNHSDYYYSPMMLQQEVNYPCKEKKIFDEMFYNQVKIKLNETLRGIEWNEIFINSLLETLEATLSFVPSSTAKDEIADISLYDHVKMTAAIGNCIYQYLDQENDNNYKERLYKNANSFYDEKAFLLYSIDMSGIQSFIYTIHTKDALRMLRAKSFYLEIMMEHIIDSILEKTGLSRANLIYLGGGHCYMLLPNTDNVKNILATHNKELNDWLLERYDISLYAADAYVETSANILKNVPENSYSDMFKELSNQLGNKKSHKYSATDILHLNDKIKDDYSRECRVCKRLEYIDDDGMCDTCRRLANMSKGILYQPFFVISNDQIENGLPLPGGCYMLAESEEQLRTRMSNNRDTFVRAYSKNDFYTGMNIATKIWVGNYTKGQTFEELAKASQGIHRLGIMRADVDNLGQAFVSGFDGKYCTLSRTATLSRQLSIFFKYYINGILEGRNATIVYSGGDDMFIVGAWNEVIELSMDIRNAFMKYTEDTLTISAGIGMYVSSYPISQMALEIGEYESKSKSLEGKNAVTLMPDGNMHSEKNGQNNVSDGTYKWDIFEQKVLNEKYKVIEQFFSGSEERGKAFLYRILELIRERKESINFARYAYLLARMEPQYDASVEQKELYRNFSRQMYEWMQSEEDCIQLKTAINIYAYKIRESEG